MMLDTLSIDDNVVRYVGFTKLDADGKVTSRAFTIDLKKRGVSVNWLEYFGGLERSDQLNSIRELMSPRLTLGGKAKLAQLNVGKTTEELIRGIGEFNSDIDQTEKICCEFWFEKTPIGEKDGKPADPSHCDIIFRPIPSNQVQINLIGALLRNCVVELHPARP